MKNILILVFILSSQFSWADKLVPIEFKWEYNKIDGPIEIYEVKKGTDPVLWKTDTVPSLDKAPVSELIKGSKIDLPYGGKKKFVLVYKNNTDEAKYFFAAPHHADPAESSLGFKFKCLCINHAYKVNPKSYWYRVVEFRLAPKFIGEKLVVTHHIIGLDSDKAQEFNQSMKSMSNGDE